MLVKCSIILLGLVAFQACSVESSTKPIAPDPVEKSGLLNLVAAPIIIGESSGISGEVKEYEDGTYLARLFSFSLEKPTELKIRKSYSSGFCGDVVTDFTILQGEEIFELASIDSKKVYATSPPEAPFVRVIPAGEHQLLVKSNFERDCFSYSYYFYLLEK